MLDALTLINTLSLALDKSTEYTPKPNSKSLLQGYQNKLESLSADQLLVVAEALIGNFDCLSIGGKAGTGKSYVLRLIHDMLESIYDVRVVVCAPTGLASQNVQGEGTYNRVFGMGKSADLLPIGMHEGDPRSRRLTVARARERAVNNLTGGRGLVIIIDEMSMLSSEVLTLMYEIATSVRPRMHKVKFILFGDALQLQRVVKEKDFPKLSHNLWERGGFRTTNAPTEIKWYESMLGMGPFEVGRQTESAWRAKQLALITNHRQAQDKLFADALNHIRIGGKIEGPAKILLDAMVSKKPLPENKYQCIHIFNNNADVASTNREAVQSVAPNLRRVYAARVDYKGVRGTVVSEENGKLMVQTKGGGNREVLIDFASEIAPVSGLVEVAVGLPFMVLQNMPDLGVFNGTIGTVDELKPESIIIKVGKRRVEIPQTQLISVPTTQSGLPIATYHQLPGTMCVALTGHKVQGQTFSDFPVIVHIRSHQVYPIKQTPGWVYVVLSRTTSMSNLYLDTDARTLDACINADPVAMEFVKRGEDEMLMQVAADNLVINNDEERVIFTSEADVDGDIAVHFFDVESQVTGRFRFGCAVLDSQIIGYAFPTDSNEWQQLAIEDCSYHSDIEKFLLDRGLVVGYPKEQQVVITDSPVELEPVVIEEPETLNAVEPSMPFPYFENADDDTVLIGDRAFNRFPNLLAAHTESSKLYDGTIVMETVIAGEKHRPCTVYKTVAEYDDDGNLVDCDGSYYIAEVHDRQVFGMYLQFNPEQFEALENLAGFVFTDEFNGGSEDGGSDVPEPSPIAPEPEPEAVEPLNKSVGVPVPASTPAPAPAPVATDSWIEEWMETSDETAAIEPSAAPVPVSPAYEEPPVVNSEEVAATEVEPQPDAVEPSVQIVVGDIWESGADAIFVTTNSIINSRGELVMGRGAAWQAKTRYPGLAKRFADQIRTICGSGGEYNALLDPETKVGALQVKYHWNSEADLELIKRSLQVLADNANAASHLSIAVNFPGIGNGKLSRAEVEPLLQVLPGNVTVYLLEETETETEPPVVNKVETEEPPVGARKIAIIGTAGRKEDAPKLNVQVYKQMYDSLVRELQQLEPDTNKRHVVSGGSAWADHLAVAAFMDGHAKYLTLHLPDPSTKGWQTLQYYHRLFCEKLGVDKNLSLSQIEYAIAQGAEVHYYHGNDLNEYASLFERNSAIAQEAQDLVAFTFGQKNQPKPDGTKDTWTKHAELHPEGRRIHVAISNL